jgi:hypothetical protein
MAHRRALSTSFAQRSRVSAATAVGLWVTLARQPGATVISTDLATWGGLVVARVDTERKDRQVWMVGLCIPSR